MAEIYVPPQNTFHKVRRIVVPSPTVCNRKSWLTNGAAVVSTEHAIIAELVTEIMKNSNQNVFVNQNFTLTSEQNLFEIERLITRNCENGWLTTVFNQVRAFDRMKLSAEAVRLVATPNAGGDSVKSEALSFELLNRCFNARLLKTEMEISYFPEGGSITDYVLCMFGRVVAVSVTRAMKYHAGQVFTNEDAHALLRKKLRGVKQSSQNMLFPTWEKQILHVWAYDEAVVETLHQAWLEMDEDLKANTVILVTLAKNSMELFVNTKKKKIVKRRYTA